MPGRVLVFDPIVTNRIMLKAQLSMDFFDVTLAADSTELKRQVRLMKPDVVLVSYQADRAAAFETVSWLKSNAATAYLPIVFLHNSDDTSIWDQTHNLMVEDVLHYRATKWLVKARLNVLIRSKERFDALVARGRTIADMGFAEQPLVFPPRPNKPFCIDMSCATGTFDDTFIAKVIDLLERDFPKVRMRSNCTPHRSGAFADLSVIDPQTVGAEVAFAKMTELRKTEGLRLPSFLYVANHNTPDHVNRALEFSAKDFVQA